MGSHGATRTGHSLGRRLVAHQRTAWQALLLGLKALSVGQLQALVDSLGPPPVVDHFVLLVSRFMAYRLHVRRRGRVTFHGCDPRAGVEASQVSLQLLLTTQDVLVAVRLRSDSTVVLYRLLYHFHCLVIGLLLFVELYLLNFHHRIGRNRILVRRFEHVLFDYCSTHMGFRAHLSAKDLRLSSVDGLQGSILTFFHDDNWWLELGRRLLGSLGMLDTLS